MKQAPVGVFLTLLLLVGLPALPGAAAQADSLRVISTNATDYPKVEMTVAAPRQLAGQDLAGHFALREGSSARDVRAVPVSGEELEVALVIDTSGSMNGAAMDAAKQAAISFVQQMPRAVRLAVIGFGDEPSVASGFSEGPRRAISAIQGLTATGETALYDAVEVALAQFSSGGQATRTIVLLSDGADTVSQALLSDTRVNLRRSKAAFHAIHLETTDSETSALRSLAKAADGALLSADDPGALAAVYAAVAKDLNNQYVLTYTSQGHGITDLRVSLPQHDVKAAAVTLQLPAAPAPPAAPPPRPPPAPAITPLAGPLPWFLALIANPWTVRAGIGAVFVALLYLGLLLTSRASSHRRSPALVEMAASRGRSHAIADAGDWAKARVDRALRDRGWTERLNDALEQAGILLRPAELILFVAGLAVAVFLAGSVAYGSTAGLFLGLLTIAMAKLFLGIKTSRRRAAFGSQLGDTLQMMAGSLRSGYGLLQAADSVAREADSPTADEFRRLVMETRLGRDIEETLRAMGDRVGSDDFKWVMQAIEIHRDVGGDLSVVLDEVGATIREREQVFRQVKALSAEGRLSAIILLALPFVVVGGISMTNPSYMDELFTTGTGRMLIGVGFVLMSLGAVWVRAIVKPKF